MTTEHRQPIQNSFAGGELTPRMNARSDVDGYHTAVEYMENFVPLAHGPAKKRSGDKWMRSITGDFGRIFDFYVSTNVGFAIAVTTDTITILDDSGVVLEEDESINGDFIDGPLGWTVDTNGGGSNVLFGEGVCGLDPGIGVTRYAGIHQQIVTIAPTAPVGIKITIESGEGELLVEVGSTEGANDIFSFTYTGLSAIRIDLPATGLSALWFSYRAPGGQPVKTLSKIEVIDLDNIPGEVSFPSPWTTATELERLQYDTPPGADDMYFVSPTVEPQGLIYIKDSRSWTFGPLAITPPGQPLSDHIWEDGNWPYTITFAQGRMWLGGLNSFGEVFWGSRSGLYFDFELIDTPEADSPLEFNLSVKGALCWMVGTKNLLIGTESGEHIITAEAGIIMAGDILSTQQSANGSAFVQPEQIGNRVLYVSGDRRKLREMGYQWQEDGWLTRDLTFMSEHITKDNLIRRVKYAKNPDGLIIITTVAGNIIGCTYERSADILAWHRHVTNGKVMDVSVLSTGGYSSKWALVDRDEEGSQLFVEKDTPDIYLDASAHAFYETPVTDIGPFTHLANKTVLVIIDGSVHPPITLDSSGNGTVQWEGQNFDVGYGYLSILLTLPLDKGAQAGSAMAMKKRWNKITVRIYDSAMPQINGRRPPVRSPSTPMDEVQPFDSDDVNVINRTYSTKGQIKIEQELPLRTMILGIFGEETQTVIK